MIKYPRLLVAIRAANLKQYQVARLARIAPSRLSQILRHGGVTLTERLRLSEVLSAPEEYLFGEGAPTPSTHTPLVNVILACLVRRLEFADLATIAGLPLFRVNEIIEYGAATTDERNAIAKALGQPADDLFAVPKKSHGSPE